MIRAFSYLADSNIPSIAVEWSENPKTDQRLPLYDFARAWDLFNQIKLDNKGPQLTFLQVMVELNLFQKETFDEVFNTLQEFRSLKDLIISDQLRYQVPIARPSKILCIGRNYKDHASELNNPLPSEPIFFAKSPSSLLAHEQPVRLPSKVGKVHHEAELAVIIGKEGADIKEDQAMEFVAGYSVVNDVTARELQQRDVKAGLPWFRAKSFDTFCPFGPSLVPRDCIADPHNLQVQLKVNDEVRQKASTADMIFTIPELISYLSRHLTLHPGDLICTGTPSGVAPLSSGDVMVTSVEGIGQLVNSIS